MKVLCIGDSITRGITGVSYVNMLAKEYPEWVIENAGVDGEPLLPITQRLQQKLEAGKPYDCIILQAGTNDVLLPTFPDKGVLFKQVYKHFLKKGRVPLAPDRFNVTYRAILEQVRRYSQAKLVVCTIGCINEDMKAESNSVRKMYNNIIRILAAQYDCAVADTGQAFEKELLPLPTHDYFLEDFLNSALLDRLQCRFLDRADDLSKARKLQLTIDGVHLNTRGAMLFKQEIEKALDYYPRAV